MINVFQPALGAEELAAIEKVFASNWIGKGRLTDRFEDAFAGFIGADRPLVRSVSCCTEGLFQSMTLLDIGEGDEVILPSIHFVGAANAIVDKGARPVFCDVEPRTLNTSAELVERAITPRTRAVFIIHYGGRPCEMTELCDLLQQHDIPLVEDSACSVASRYRGQACGTFGDLGIWSFDSMKILVTGDGGMIYCNSEELAQRAEQSLYLGLVGSSGFSSGAGSRWWEFGVARSGRRAIMNDMSSAIGLEQLQKLPGFIAERQRVWDYYNQHLAQLEWLQVPPALPEYVESSYYFYNVSTRPGLRDRLASFLKERGVYTTFRYYPLHLVPFYEFSGALPNTDEAAETTLCLPLHQSLTDADLDTVVQAVLDFGESV